RPIQTRFRYGSVFLTLPDTSNSLARYAKSTRSLGQAQLPQVVGTRFQVLFHSPSGVLFTFPSRYSFTIGRQEYLALDGGPPSFPHERPSTWYSGGRSRRPCRFRLRGCHPLWPAFP